MLLELNGCAALLLRCKDRGFRGNTIACHSPNVTIEDRQVRRARAGRVFDSGSISLPASGEAMLVAGRPV